MKYLLIGMMLLSFTGCSSTSGHTLAPPPAAIAVWTATLAYPIYLIMKDDE